MPDIEKCTGILFVTQPMVRDPRNGMAQQYELYCKISNKCERFKATFSEPYQWISPPAPDFKPESGCSNFMEVRK